VNATREMADLITAVRAYEANIDVQENFVRMADRALRLAQ
jgi:flagellar basal body rod protein FlgC